MPANLLVIMTDQHQAEALSCAGHLDVATPNLDRLAARGVRFSRAYTPHPLCGPARASLATGRMPSQLGYLTNQGRLTEAEIAGSVGHRLRARGYAAAYGGKWHVPRIDLRADGPLFGFDCLCGFDDHALPEAIAEYLARPHDQPFLCWASFDDPHNICEHARDQLLPWGEVVEGDPAAYPNLPPNHAPPAFAAGVIASHQPHYIVGRLSETFDEARWRRYRYVYFRLIERVDARIGVILDALDASGRAEDTLVLFTSDHGDLAGAHGLNQKSWLYEEAVRVPLIVAGPGVRHGAVCDALVSTGLDVLPTLLDYAGAAADPGLSGCSLRPWLTSADPVAWRNEVLVQTEIDGTSLAGRMLVTGSWKYVCYDRGAHREMLFDLTSDPGELINRAVEARYAGILNDLRDRLRAQCQAIQDPFGRQDGYRRRIPPSTLAR